MRRMWTPKKTLTVIILLVGVVVFCCLNLGLLSTLGFKDYVTNVTRNISLKKKYTSNDVTSDVTSDQRYDLLVNGYWRSGTSFTGRLLSIPEDRFYWFEPLMNYTPENYFWGKDKICNHTDCRHVARCTANVTLHPRSMQHVLEKIYRCDFSNLVPAVMEGMTDIHSGNSWADYRDCRKPFNSPDDCLFQLQQVCKKAKHRVTKVVRLTVDNLEHLLATNFKIKVIHMFRDPRAILNSRLTTKWFNLKETPLTNHSEIKRSVKNLCNRMLYDFRAGLDLKRSYPNRFAFVFHEEFMENVTPLTKTLCSYFGADTASLESSLESMGEFQDKVLLKPETDKNFSGWWRKSLKFNIVAAVDELCSDVYDVLGYVRMSDNATLMNSAVRSYKVHEEFRVERINRNVPYNITLM